MVFLLKVIISIVSFLAKSFIIVAGISGVIFLLVFAVALIADKTGLLGEFDRGYDDE